MLALRLKPALCRVGPLLGARDPLDIGPPRVGLPLSGLVWRADSAPAPQGWYVEGIEDQFFLHVTWWWISVALNRRDRCRLLYLEASSLLS